MTATGPEAKWLVLGLPAAANMELTGNWRNKFYRLEIRADMRLVAPWLGFRQAATAPQIGFAGLHLDNIGAAF